MKPNVINVTEAARQKGCSRQTIYNAISRGELNTAEIGSVTMVLKDGKWKAFKVQETGGRLHDSFQADNGDKSDTE